MVPVNSRTGFNSMGEISSICHCIARNIDIITCIQNICNRTRTFRIILEIIGYISSKLLALKEIETGADIEHINRIIKSEDYFKVCSNKKTYRKFVSTEFHNLHNIGNKTQNFCKLRKMYHESVFKYFNKLNEPKLCDMRKKTRTFNVKTKINTVIPKLRKLSKPGFETKMSSAPLILPKIWLIWLCRLVVYNW